MAAEVQRELEATRGELKRGVFELPRETTEAADAMRRVVGDQIKALKELAAVVAPHGFDISDPGEPDPAPVPPPAPAAPARIEGFARREPAPAKPPAPVEPIPEPAAAPAPTVILTPETPPTIEIAPTPPAPLEAAITAVTLTPLPAPAPEAPVEEPSAAAARR